MVLKKLIQSGKSTITLAGGSAVANIAIIEFSKLFISNPVVVVTFEFISAPIITSEPPIVVGTTFDVTETGFKVIISSSSGLNLSGFVYKVNWIARGTGEWIEPIHPCISNDCCNNNCFNNCCNNCC